MSEGLPQAKITDRFLAFIVDSAPFMAGYYASLHVLTRRLGSFLDDPALSQRAVIAWLALYMLYQTAGNLSGATLGKRLFGIRVIARGGEGLGLGRSALRAAGYLISMPLMNLGFLWSLVDKESRGWHDIIAGSVVVEVDSKSPTAALGSAALSLVLVLVILAGNAFFMVRAPSPGDAAAVAKAREGLRVLSAIEQSYRAEHGVYTEKLSDLARASGDVGKFKAAMEKIFRPDGFVFQVSENGYVLRARAKDGRGTVVTLEGP